MKRHALTIALSASVLAITASSAFADFTLNILHINDLHSRIEAINKFDSTCSEKEAAENACFGGVARVHTKINERRNALKGEGKNVLVLDAGDQFQGSLFYSTFKGKAELEFMNGIGFDAMAVGNHEFDDGPDVLATFIDSAKFPVISGNTLVGANEKNLAGKIKEYLVNEIGGQKVAIVSVLATDTDETSAPGKNVLIVDEISYLKSVVAKLEGEGVNKIILLSHVGLPKDREIAAAVPGIDVIVGGHSHTLMSNTVEGAPKYPEMVKNPAGKDVPIVQAYAYSKYVGEVAVTFDDAGNVTAAKGDPILLDASVTPDATVAARVKELGVPLEEIKKKEVGSAAGDIDGSRDTCRAQECAMGNLVADAMLDRVKDQGITIAVQNGGGVRATIKAGTVTMGDVLTVLPFQNTVATFQIKGADLVAALENGVSKVEEGAGRFAQVSGMKYTFDMNKPAGSRVSDVMVAEGGSFVPIDAAKTYGVVTNNYVRTGGDGFKVFATNAMNAYDFGPNLENLVAEYITANSPYKPVDNSGRITKIASTAPAAPAEPAKPAAPAAAAPAAAPAAPAAQAEVKVPVRTGMELALPTTGPKVEGAPAMAKVEMKAEVKPEMKPADGAAKTHMIVAGDNLWNLAKSYYGDGQKWKMIADANPGTVVRNLVIGSQLAIPASN